jgi:5,5'-dehydrodivanillate O-demethylase oxygenase subunit
MTVEPLRDYRDFVHTGPGTLAGRYMRTFWQPVWVSDQLAPGTAKPVRIMGEDFTLYRGDMPPGAPPLPSPPPPGGREGTGRAYLVGFRCAHRGTQLSTGWVEGDDIRCRYHGWKYDGSGQCTEVPGDASNFCLTVRIEHYPVQEYLGLIFAYLGEGDPPPLPRYPDYETGGVVTADWNTRPCNFFNILENGADPVHFVFTHDRNLGLMTVEAEETPWGVMTAGMQGDVAAHLNQCGMPNILDFATGPDPEFGMVHTLAWRVPIDDESHWSFSVRHVPVTGELADRYRAKLAAAPKESLDLIYDLADKIMHGNMTLDEIVLKGTSKVNLEDHVTQVGQGAIADRVKERLRGPSDAGLLLLRQVWMRELKALAEGRPLTNFVRTDDVRSDKQYAKWTARI